jgi:hypothetical protein
MNPNFLHGMPNLQLIIFPTSPGECGNTTWVSEGVSPSEENATFRSIPYPMGEVDANTGKVEVDNGKNVPLKQSDKIYIYLGVGLLIIAIGVVLAFIILKRRGRTGILRIS